MCASYGPIVHRCARRWAIPAWATGRRQSFGERGLAKRGLPESLGAIRMPCHLRSCCDAPHQSDVMPRSAPFDARSRRRRASTLQRRMWRHRPGHAMHMRAGEGGSGRPRCRCAGRQGPKIAAPRLPWPRLARERRPQARSALLRPSCRHCIVCSGRLTAKPPHAHGVRARARDWRAAVITHRSVRLSDLPQVCSHRVEQCMALQNCEVVPEALARSLLQFITQHVAKPCGTSK